ncbi:uncharacterized protein B0I36DRAFT_364883 [Microdochium trichocladiopsis]|uniref:Sm domain-containing protein n=1 Tax=Microdochium trichocladiopsis TaxID=1682393 RepID=A0A9P9BRW9_9PEZI|nr:uncharacterized protein B0I36DRAFT_364883 [Microdochium trichocladiopsis]KAH7027715.1 hypothetical protein B0I36DRAFT_364883 [Microdochium trichocladiopsis]
MSLAENKAEAESFIKGLINKTLRIQTKDSRLFVGTFKCTDPESNVVLALTYEYRQPSKQQLDDAAAAAILSGADKVVSDMTSRYLGLVVIPGEQIVKLEVEEFVSQMRSRSVLERRNIYGNAGVQLPP